MISMMESAIGDAETIVGRSRNRLFKFYCTIPREGVSLISVHLNRSAHRHPSDTASLDIRFRIRKDQFHVVRLVYEVDHGIVASMVYHCGSGVKP